jgi:hypothetical protein
MLTGDYFCALGDPLRCAGPFFEPAGPATPTALPAVPAVGDLALLPAVEPGAGSVRAAGPFFEPAGPATPLASWPVGGLTLLPEAGPDVLPKLL